MPTLQSGKPKEVAPGPDAPELDPEVLAEDVLQDAPVESSGRTRHATPERAKPVKRSSNHDDEPAALRVRVGIDADMEPQQDVDGPLEADEGMSGHAPTSPASIPQPDSDMDSLYDALTDDEKKIIASVIRGADVTEIYSPVRVNQIAAKLGLVPGYSLDLTNGWDFTSEADRKRAWKCIKETKPYMLIGSPPCTMFSMLQELNLRRSLVERIRS